MLHLRTVWIVLLLPLLCSCNSKRAEQADAVASLVGREIVMPENLVCQIQSDTIGFGFGDADFTIVAYIDSAGCTSCRMKLRDWDNLINQLKVFPDVSVDFIMVINSSETTELNYIIKRDNFLHPICFDPDGAFATCNQLPGSDTYHTFLLDGNGEIVLVGNPAINPKIRELYKGVIMEETDVDIKSMSMPLGAIYMGDSVVKKFEVHNGDADFITVQELVPSCDCVSTTINLDTIPHGKSGILTVSFVADSIVGPASRYVDIYFNEKENPERYIVHGYVITNPNQ